MNQAKVAVCCGRPDQAEASLLEARDFRLNEIERDPLLKMNDATLDNTRYEVKFGLGVRVRLRISFVKVKLRRSARLTIITRPVFDPIPNPNWKVAELYRSMGQYVEAEATMREAVKDNPDKMNKDFLQLIIDEKPKGTDNHFTSISTSVTMMKFGKKLLLEVLIFN